MRLIRWVQTTTRGGLKGQCHMGRSQAPWLECCAISFAFGFHAEYCITASTTTNTQRKLHELHQFFSICPSNEPPVQYRLASATHCLSISGGLMMHKWRVAAAGSHYRISNALPMGPTLSCALPEVQILCVEVGNATVWQLLHWLQAVWHPNT